MSAKKFTRTNNDIRVPEVMLIDHQGNKIGVVATDVAKAKAAEVGLDLVEVSPNAKPPVAKIMDFKQIRYEEKRNARKNKIRQRKVDTKGIRLTIRTDVHDMQHKSRSGKKFLEQGHRMRVEVRVRGREKAHMHLAEEKLREFLQMLETPVTVLQEPKTEAFGISTIVSKK